jgi:amino acid transporter
MSITRALAARASCARRSILPWWHAAGRALSSAGRQLHAAVTWAEDHDETLIPVTAVVLVVVIVILLLWKTARVISLAREFEPVLTSVAALFAILLGVLNLLRARRDRREKDAAAPQPPAPGTAPDNSA